MKILLTAFEPFGGEPVNPAEEILRRIEAPAGAELQKLLLPTAFREAGVPPERLLGLLAHWCGWAAEGESVSLRDLLGRFDLARLPRTPALWRGDACLRGKAAP